MDKMRDVLVYFSCLHKGDWKKIYHSIEKKEEIDFNKLQAYKAQIKSQYVTILDKHYPNAIKQSYYPPYVLFYRGDASLLQAKRKVAIIGSRLYSEYGKIMAQNLALEFSQNNHVVVSGGAKGIDIIAQNACLQGKGKTIAVVGSGLDYYYPKENKESLQLIEKNGLVISEYPPTTPPNKTHFPARNRLIASLADAIIVVEAKPKSGTLITVRHALDLGKDVYCVPYRVSDKSMCNELIKQGAMMIESYQDYQQDEMPML